MYEVWQRGSLESFILFAREYAADRQKYTGYPGEMWRILRLTETDGDNGTLFFRLKRSDSRW